MGSTRISSVSPRIHLVAIPEMAHQRVLIYGAGGHGKVVLDILERIAEYEIVGWVDDAPTRSGSRFCGYPILGSLEVLLERGVQEQVVVAIGDNKTREDLVRRLESEGWEFATAIHPSASIARDVTLDSGTVVMANVAVNSGTVVGRHVILNTGATVDHDCAIGDFAQISPGVHLGGSVTVGSQANVGIGASVIPGIAIGTGSVIGAGAAVVCDIPSYVIATGVPARVIKRTDKGRDQ